MGPSKVSLFTLLWMSRDTVTRIRKTEKSNCASSTHTRNQRLRRPAGDRSAQDFVELLDERIRVNMSVCFLHNTRNPKRLSLEAMNAPVRMLRLHLPVPTRQAEEVSASTNRSRVLTSVVPR